MNKLWTHLIFLLVPSLIWASPPQFRSLESGFRRFVTESRNADFEMQLKHWVEDVESAAPEIYAHILRGEESEDLGTARRKAAARLFPFLIANSDAILGQFRDFSDRGIPRLLRLSEAYSDADMSRVEVWALPSLDKFNGQVATIAGRVRVMFGMDMLEHIHQQPDFQPGAVLVNDLPVLMAHEYTHALHYTMSDFGESDPSAASFWGPLWDEGLAEVNSQMLDPGSDLTTVFMEKRLAQACNREIIGRWSALYVRDSLIPVSRIEEAYARWFMMSAGLAEHGVYRAGYCLGYYVILRALQTHSMHEILQMRRADAYALGREALAEFSR